MELIVKEVRFLEYFLPMIWNKCIVAFKTTACLNNRHIIESNAHCSHEIRNVSVLAIPLCNEKPLSY